MIGGLVRGRCKQNDQFDRLAVHRIVFNRFGRDTDCDGDMFRAVCLAVRNGQPFADAGGTLLLALPDNLFEDLGVRDDTRFSEKIDQFVNGFLLLKGIQWHLDGIG